jgi:hypothetical protein
MYVYVISNPSFEGWLKVGKTKNLVTRLNALQTGSPHEYQYETVTEFTCDKPIHNRLISMGIERKREWFKTDLDTIESAIADVVAQWAEEGINDQ